MMLKLLRFVSLSCVLVGVLAQVSYGKSSISGKVTDAQGIPLESVTVGIPSLGKGTFTNKEGEYQLKNLPSGNLEIIFSEVGYQPVRKNIDVGIGESLTLDIVLQENNAELAAVYIEATALGDRDVLKEVEGAALYANKKTELLSPTAMNANLPMNVSRQVFAKVPGIMIWENDGSGVQTGVSTRGLSPNRSWEFNVRQNGYDVSSDPFGYPEAYFNPPLEAVEQIQIVRGAASLQFGPQFGGLLNYVIKKPQADKKIAGQLSNTLGSFGLRNTFLSLNGTLGRWSYYGYVNSRGAEGWRQNSRYNIGNAYMRVEYAASKKLSIGLDITAMNYQNQQPGGLTDSAFRKDARTSQRSRNWFSTPWLVPALKARWAIDERQTLEVNTFALLGERNSIGLISAANQPDTFNVALGSFAPRQIDRDRYVNVGIELRHLADIRLLGIKTSLATGLRYSNGNTLRQQLGRGDTGTDFNLSLKDDRFRRELNFNNANWAVYAEWNLRLSKRLSLTPGLRYENLRSTAEGRLNILPDGSELKIEPLDRTRSFILAGLGLGYKVSYSTAFYANYSQAYRPILFSDLSPSATTDVIDPDLKDASGYNLDAGYRGKVGSFLNFDLGVFLLRYDNRIGTLRQLNTNNSGSFQFRTNVGDTESRGLETYVEMDLLEVLAAESKAGQLQVFVSATLMEARYLGFRINSVSGTAPNQVLVEGDLKNNKVEYAPDYIIRWGATYRLQGFSFTLQQSSTAEVYTDANNSELPNAAATSGKLEGYSLVDLSMSYNLKERYRVNAGINNLLDARYATRRAGGYPGPGILPGEARSLYVGLVVHF